MKKSIFGLSIVTSMLLAESFTLGQVSVLENIKDINLFEQSISPEVISQNSSDTVSEALDNLSGNYTYISIKNRDNGSVEIVDVPKHQFFTFAQKEVAKNVSLYANMKFRDGAYENKLNGTYVTNPNFTTFDLKAIYEPTKNLTAEIGVKNLTDELVRYDMAYPMAGREFFASLDYKF